MPHLHAVQVDYFGEHQHTPCEDCNEAWCVFCPFMALLIQADENIYSLEATG